MTHYRSVSTHDLAGLKRAEWYKAHGWTCYKSGLFMLYFLKETQ